MVWWQPRNSEFRSPNCPRCTFLPAYPQPCGYGREFGDTWIVLTPGFPAPSQLSCLKSGLQMFAVVAFIFLQWHSLGASSEVDCTSKVILVIPQLHDLPVTSESFPRGWGPLLPGFRVLKWWQWLHSFWHCFDSVECTPVTQGPNRSNCTIKQSNTQANHTHSREDERLQGQGEAWVLLHLPGYVTRVHPPEHWAAPGRVKAPPTEGLFCMTGAGRWLYTLCFSYCPWKRVLLHLLLVLCMSVQCPGKGQRSACRNLFSSSIMWVLEMWFRLSGLVASTFTCQTPHWDGFFPFKSIK